jgi:hypothetical protein
MTNKDKQYMTKMRVSPLLAAHIFIVNYYIITSKMAVL